MIEASHPASSVARGLGSRATIRWPLRRADQLFLLRYGKALIETSRRFGTVPVYGTNGQTGWHDTPLFEGPGVIVGRKGVGHLGVEWTDGDFWVIDTAYALETLGSTDLKFVYYLVRHVGLDHLKHGTSNPSLTREAFGSQYLPDPPLRSQRVIAATLGALDDKIESNRRIVQLIPLLIRLLVTQATIGDGQEVAVAGLGSFVNGGAYTRGASGTGRMVIRIAELNSGPGGSTIYSDIDTPDNKTARPGDLLMSWSGSLGVYRWVLDEAIVNQHIFKVLPSDEYPAWLVFDRLAAVMPRFRGIAKDKATTMGHIQRGHLESTLIAVPLPPTIRTLDRQIAPLWQRLLWAEQESVKLAALRDTLLPELLSGRIRVSEAREVVAEVTTVV